MSSSELEFAEEVSEARTQAEEASDKLSEFFTWLEETEQEYEEMDEETRSAFRQEVRHLRAHLKNVENVSELLDLQEETENALQEPILRATKSALDELLDTVDSSLTEENREDIEDSYEDMYPTELQRIIDAYEEAIEILEDEPDHISRKAGQRITSEAQMLRRPGENLVSFIEELQQQRQNLDQLAAAVQELGEFIPAEISNLSEQGRNYQNESLEDHEIEAVSDQIDSIQESQDDLQETGVPIADILSNEFAFIHTEGPNQIISKVQRVNNQIGEIETYSLVLEQLEPLCSWTSENEIDDDKLSILCDNYDSIIDSSSQSLSDLNQSLEDLEGEYNSWVEEIIEELQRLSGRAETLRDTFDELDPVSTDIDIDELTSEQVKREPVEAIEARITFRTWIEEAYDTIDAGSESGHLGELWRQLKQEGSISVSECDTDALSELGDMLGDSLTVMLEE